MTTLLMLAAILALLCVGATVISRAVALRFWGLLAVVTFLFLFPLPVAMAPIFVRLMVIAR